MEYQTGVTKAVAYKDEPLQVDTHQSEPLPQKDATVGNQSPQDSISYPHIRQHINYLFRCFPSVENISYS